MKQISYIICIIWLLIGCNQTQPSTPTVEIEPSATSTKIAKVAKKETATPTPQATATPKLATPIASPTPTVTPTPIIYTIQPGDTLLKIAIQFDRTSEAIQEANGIVDPRFLQIGQSLIIPAPEQSFDAPPTLTPTPPLLTVTSIYFQRTKQGLLWSLGTVYNPGSQPLTEVVVEAALLDGEGVLLAREATFTQLDVVRPNESVPFALRFENPPDEFAQYQVVAVAGVPMSPQARYYFDLETFDVRGNEESKNSYRIRGQLRNHGSSDVETIRLVVIVYDDEDQVLAQRQAELAVTLFKAGSTTPFELDLIIPNGIVDHYKVLAQGLRVE